MDRFKMARRLRQVADHLEQPIEPVETHIKQVMMVIIRGHDKDGNEAILVQFHVLPNSVFSTGRIPMNQATENISIMIRPL